ncbi:MAG TPA: hypothetical protein VHM23_01490 [Actinomycetota bacterium]|nr:hypothetical protein [Actinomycetota bacterium]
MRRLAVAVVVLAAAVVIVAGLNLGRLELVWEDVVLDGRSTRIPCGQRPPAAEARLVLARRGDLVRRIQAVDQSVFVSLEESGCPGRGTLVIAYGAHGHRKRIERLIGGDSVFGVPYSLRNV